MWGKIAADLVLGLGTFLRALDSNAGGNVLDAHGCLHFVHVLAPCTGVRNPSIQLHTS